MMDQLLEKKSLEIAQYGVFILFCFFLFFGGFFFLLFGVLTKYKTQKKKITNSYQPLNDGSKIDYCKNMCGQNVHVECFEHWCKVTNTNAPNCIMCRTPWMTPGFIYFYFFVFVFIFSLILLYNTWRYTHGIIPTNKLSLQTIIKTNFRSENDERIS